MPSFLKIYTAAWGVRSVIYLQMVREEGKLREGHEIARKTLVENKEKEKEHYDEKQNEINFQVGDRVLLRNDALRRGRSRKLSPPFQGPYLVTDVSGVNCTIQINQKGRKLKVHKNRLRLYIS